MHKIIETHCHLDYLKEATVDQIIDEAHKAGIEKIITISVEPDNFESVLKLTRDFEFVYGTQGVHPHDAKKVAKEHYDMVKEFAEDNQKIVAIGEIGLDYHYNNSPRKTQIDVFENFLELASQIDYPVVIHSRDADDDMLAILKNFRSTLKKRGVIHSFTSGPELAKAAIEMGFYLGFNGIITFKSAENVREIVEICPCDRLLLETDSPFLTPVPHRGQENAPKFLPHILKKLSEIKQVEESELASLIYQNSLQLFALN